MGGEGLPLIRTSWLVTPSSGASDAGPATPRCYACHGGIRVIPLCHPGLRLANCRPTPGIFFIPTVMF